MVGPPARCLVCSCRACAPVMAARGLRYFYSHVCEAAGVGVPLFRYLPAWHVHHSGAFEPPQLLWAAFDAFLAGTGVFSGGCQYTDAVCVVSPDVLYERVTVGVCVGSPQAIFSGEGVCA
jgi:hypothetical protein